MGVAVQDDGRKGVLLIATSTAASDCHRVGDPFASGSQGALKSSLFKSSRVEAIVTFCLGGNIHRNSCSDYERKPLCRVDAPR
jgi:hypothetical protein